jgi:hypothetical protein
MRMILLLLTGSTGTSTRRHRKLLQKYLSATLNLGPSSSLDKTNGQVARVSSDLLF